LAAIALDISYYYLVCDWVYLLFGKSRKKIEEAKERFIETIDFPPLKLPMIIYPDCQACDCGSEILTPDPSILIVYT
jgi:hypothetical protein